MQFDPQLVERQSIYKLLIGCVVPRPIAWVSSISADAIANVAPFSFFMAVCNDPPTLAFSSGRRAGGKKIRCKILSIRRILWSTLLTMRSRSR